MSGKLTLDEVVSPENIGSANDLREAIVSFLDDFSIEATPHAAAELDSYPEYLPSGTTVYVAHPPNSQLDEVVLMSRRLRELGFNPVPHLIARKLESRAQLEASLEELRMVGIEQILLVAGDLSKPVGPYSCAMDVLETGLLPQNGFLKVGIAGHPEGSRAIGPIALHQALADKVQWAADTGLQMYFVTQFGFNAQAVFDWEAALAKDGIALPIHVGMAGQAPLKQLLRYAMRCGITASMRTLIAKVSAMSEQIKLATVEDLVVEFAKHRLSHPDCRMLRAHFYAFGGAERTARWLNAVTSGAFELSKDGRKIVTSC
jgi:methylenetetrahydrofolate reductase (NADPH)